MAHDYLLKEYELCFEQLRFYDKRQESILQYLFSLASAATTAEFAVYKFLHSATVDFFWFLSFLSGVVFVSTLLLTMSLVQNRLYFIYIARQLNAIRGYLMRVEAGGFHDNQLYTSTNFPALKPFSIHTFQLVGASLISSLFTGLTAYAIRSALGLSRCIALGIVISIIALVAELTIGMGYLVKCGSRTADEAVHRASVKK
jgi:hypothetical protein